MYTQLESLQRLVEAVETAHANIAPTYHEYMPMAFGIANSCGEAGRPFFHRLCAPSPRYVAKDADRLYDNALKSGRNTNSLGTVWHLAENAGVDLVQLRHLDISPYTPHTHTHAGTLYTPSPSTPCAEPPAPSAEAEEPDLPEKEDAYIPEPFQEYAWPGFVQRCVDCGRNAPQRDVLLLSVLTTLGATMADLTGFYYGNRLLHPCLQVFLIAPPASGKGVMGWARRLAQPLHDELSKRYDQACAIYRNEKQKWDALGKERANQPEPERPKRKLFFISGDNTGTGIQENLIDQDGIGMISESEASILSAAISSDYGNWSHTLRKAFDHDGLSYNRRTNYEHRECNRLLLSVLISGTPGQVRPLIPSAENGLFSRQLFYHMPPITEWVSQFHLKASDFNMLFESWGERWRVLLASLHQQVSRLVFTLDTEQETYFDTHLASLFQHGNMVHGAAMRSAVARIAINLLRLMNIVAVMRVLDPLLMQTDETAFQASLEQLIPSLLASPTLRTMSDASPENVKDGTVSTFEVRITEDDFQAVMALAEPLYRQSVHALSQLPDEQTAVRKPSGIEQFLSSLPIGFSRQEAIDIALRCGLNEKSCDKYLQRLMAKGTLERGERGEYHFSEVYRKE